jgi:O-antigen ligase
MRVTSIVALMLAINFVAPPGELFGRVSLEYLKQTVLLGAGLGFLVVFPRFRRVGGDIGLVLGGFGLLVGFASLSLFWSYAPISSLRYVNKLWLTMILVLAVLTVRPTERHRVVRYLEWMMVAYVVLSLVSEAVLRDVLHPSRIGDPRFAGFSDIHPTKYVMSVICLFLAARGIQEGGARRWLVATVAGVAVILSLQRALIVATAGGLAIMLLVSLARSRRIVVAALGVVGGMLVVAGTILLVFRFQPLRERTFPSEVHATVAEELLTSGRVREAYALVQTHGRETLWRAALELERPIGGWGFGTAGVRIEQATGEYCELHNDYLKLLMETGVVGMILYGMFILMFLGVGIRRCVRARTPGGAAMFLAAVGCFAVAPLNGIVDNALDHVTRNVAMAMIFLIFGEGMDRWQSYSGLLPGESGNRECLEKVDG